MDKFALLFLLALDLVGYAYYGMFDYRDLDPSKVQQNWRRIKEFHLDTSRDNLMNQVHTFSEVESRSLIQQTIAIDEQIHVAPDCAIGVGYTACMDVSFNA